MSERIQYTQWLQRGPNTFIPTDNSKTILEIPPGVYNLRSSQNVGFYLFKKELKLDELIKFDTPEIIDTMAGIQKFWDQEAKFKEYGFVHKRGILLYGAPGTGKTSLINLVIDKLINDHNGVVFVLNTADDLGLYESCLPEIYRVIEPNRKVITIIEDIDGFCSGRSTETTLINILDGIEQSDNILYLATTNYPERIPARLLNRPNRFDRRIKVGFPPPGLRKQYFENKLHKSDLDNIDINKWVAKTEGMSIAHLGELIKSVIILENDFLETINILAALKETPNSVSLEKGNDDDSVGFKLNSRKNDNEIAETSEDDLTSEEPNVSKEQNLVGFAGRQ